MDLAHLPEALAAVVLERRPLVKVHGHRELPGLHLPRTDGRPRAELQPPRPRPLLGFPTPGLRVVPGNLPHTRCPRDRARLPATLPPCHRRPWRRHLDDRGRHGEEPLVLREVLHPQRGRHDEQLQWQVPLRATGRVTRGGQGGGDLGPPPPSGPSLSPSLSPVLVAKGPSKRGRSDSRTRLSQGGGW